MTPMRTPGALGMRSMIEDLAAWSSSLISLRTRVTSRGLPLDTADWG